MHRKTAESAKHPSHTFKCIAEFAKSKSDEVSVRIRLVSAQLLDVLHVFVRYGVTLVTDRQATEVGNCSDTLSENGRFLFGGLRCQGASPGFQDWSICNVCVRSLSLVLILRTWVV